MVPRMSLPRIFGHLYHDFYRGVEKALKMKGRGEQGRGKAWSSAYQCWSLRHF